MHDSKTTYHHGNLRPALIRSALKILDTEGTERLSMRALAEALNVSRSALYHHFESKQALLAAIAEQGFSHLNKLVEDSIDSKASNETLDAAVAGYLRFATSHKAQYTLMFSPLLWHTEAETPFQRYAKDCFRLHVSLFEKLQLEGVIKSTEPPLRLAQIIWSSLHGLAMLMNDEILSTHDELDTLSQHLVNRFR